METYDVAIIGSGPSGLTAAIYTTRANLKTVVLAGRAWGGQLMLTTDVENFPGFPDGILGPQLMMNMRKQAEKHGATLMDVNFSTGDFTKNTLELTTDDEKKIQAKVVIIATGAETKWLDVPGEKEHIGKGISSCAPCDAAFYRNKKVIVVGGGDSAMEEAEVLTKFAEHVWIVYRGDTLRASKIMQDRAFANPKITFIFNTQITEILGELTVSAVKFQTTCSDGSIIVKPQEHLVTQTPEQLGGKTVEKTETKTTWEFPINGVFVAIGHIPNSKVFTTITADEKGYITVNDKRMTNIDRVFVAGDVHDHTYAQAVTAAGYGCMAALSAERYLRDLEMKPSA